MADQPMLENAASGLPPVPNAVRQQGKTEAPPRGVVAHAERTNGAVTAKPETSPIKGNERIGSDLKRDMLGFMLKRSHDSEQLAARGEVPEGLDAVLLKQLDLQKKGEPNIFTKLGTDGGDLSDEDIALVWSTLAITETSGLSATGIDADRHLLPNFGNDHAQTEDAHARLTKVAERPGRGIFNLPREIRLIRKTRTQLERAMHKGGMWSPHHLLSEKGMMPAKFDLANGNAFRTAVADRIDVWERSSGKDWSKFCKTNPEEANAVLHNAYEVALPLIAGSYVEKAMEHPESKSTVDAIDAHITTKINSGKKEASGGDLKEKESALKTAQKDLDAKKRELSRTERRYADLSTEVKNRATRKEGLRLLPDRIKGQELSLKTAEENLGQDIEELKKVTKTGERTVRTDAIEQRRKTIADLQARIDEMKATLKKYQDEDAVDVDATTADAQKTEVQELKEKLDGRAGLKAQVEDAEDKLTTKTNERDEASEKAEDQSNQESAPESNEVGQLRLWKNDATADGFNAMQEAVWKDRLNPTYALYSRDHLSNTTEVVIGTGDDAVKTVQGTEAIRRLVFQEAAAAAGNATTFNADRAREALRDTDIVFAMMNIDDTVGSRAIADRPTGLDPDITTVRQLANEVAKLRKGSETEKKTATAYEQVLIRSALPAMAENRWITTQVAMLASRIAHEGVQQAAAGQSVINLEGLQERKAVVEIRSVETLAKRDAGSVDVTVDRKGRTKLTWKGDARRRKQRGPGHEFKDEADEINKEPNVQVSSYELTIDGEFASESMDADVTPGLLQKLPANLKGGLAELQVAFPTATEVELRKIRKKYYRKRSESKEDRAKKKKEEEAKEQKPKLARAPKTGFLARTGTRQDLLGFDRGVRSEKQFDTEDIDGMLIRLLGVTQEAADVPIDALTAKIGDRVASATAMATLSRTEQDLIDRRFNFPPEQEGTAEQAIDMLSWTQLAVIGTIQDSDLRNRVLQRLQLSAQHPAQNTAVIEDQIQRRWEQANASTTTPQAGGGRGLRAILQRIRQRQQQAARKQNAGQGIFAEPGAITPQTANGLFEFYAQSMLEWNNQTDVWGMMADATPEAQAYAQATRDFMQIKDPVAQAALMEKGKQQFESLSLEGRKRVRKDARYIYNRFPADLQAPKPQEYIPGPLRSSEAQQAFTQRERAQQGTIATARRVITMMEIVADSNNGVSTIEAFSQLPKDKQEALIAAQQRLDRLDSLSRRQRSLAIESVGTEVAIIDKLEDRIAQKAVDDALEAAADLDESAQEAIRSKEKERIRNLGLSDADRTAYWKEINDIAAEIFSEEKKKPDKEKGAKDNEDDGEYVLRIRQGTKVSWFGGTASVALIRNRVSQGQIGKADTAEQQGIHQVVDRITNTDSMEADAFGKMAIALGNKLVWRRKAGLAGRRDLQEFRNLLRGFSGVNGTYTEGGKPDLNYSINVNTENTGLMIQIKDPSGEDKTYSLEDYFNTLKYNVNAADPAAMEGIQRQIQSIQKTLGIQVMESIAVV